MLNLRRAWAACLYDLRRNTHSIKLYAMLGMLLIYCDTLSGGLGNFLRQYDQHINAFGLSGFYLSDPRYTLLLVIACMAVFSNAPFIDDMQLFFIMRTRKHAWIVGQLLYILIMSFSLVVLMSFLPWLLFPDRLQFGNEWGKALNTLSQTNVQHAYGIGITFPRKLTIMFSPLSMYLLGLLFKWLTVATFAQVMFAMNIVFHKRVGLPLVLIYAIADLSIELMLSSEFYRFSLVSLSRLNTLGTGYQNVLPTLRYRVITIPLVWGLSTIICYIIAVRANVLESF